MIALVRRTFFLVLLLALQGVSAKAPLPPSPAQYGMTLRTVWIPMKDGVRLAADLYMPTGAKPGTRFPVLFNYLPYRKDESRGNRYPLFSYFVKRGYVVARVDIRGTGDSEGHLIHYEYTDQELNDGEVVIDWLSKQPWSNGKVGMFGISWGGFNSIMMAMRNPPALKAIIPLMATDELYHDDVHYMDGIMHVDAYTIGQDLDNAMPKPPDYKVDAAYYKNRFDTTPWMFIYKHHQINGPFWSRASLCRDYSLIKIPVFMIGGWYDGYRDSIPRMLEHVKAPIKAMIGPWNHTFPNWAVPPPAMEWRNEAVRWFDYWLKGRDTGIMDEPRFAVYVRHWNAPGVRPGPIAGEWRWENGWPIKRIHRKALYLEPDHQLGEMPTEKARHLLKYVPSAGIEGSGSVMWWGDWAPDQRKSDTYSLVYETPPLKQDLEILGFPTLKMHVSASAPLADWVGRLSDVSPDGEETLVTGEAIDGAQRDDSMHPRALVPGKVYPLTLQLHFTSWVFPKGHRIRIAINNALWPMLWPTPYPMTTTLELGGENASRLMLPVVPAVGPPRPKPHFLPPVEASNEPQLPGYKHLYSETWSGYPEITTVVHNQRTHITTVTATDSGADQFPWGKSAYTAKIVHQTNDTDPAHTSIHSRYTVSMETPGRKLVLVGLLVFSSDKDNFYYKYTRQLLENGKLLHQKHWKATIPREFQ